MSATALDVPARDGPVRRIEAAECFLTFDDGPDDTWTPRVLDALSRAGITATFFVIGQLAHRRPVLLRAARAAGHRIENHGYSHRHPWTLTPARARREVSDGAAAIADALGERPSWFRPPHGRLGPWLRDAVRADGQRVVLWSVSAVDWGPLATPASIGARLARVRAGDIVLMHDGPLRHNRPASTLAALGPWLARLTHAGPRPAPLPATVTMAG